jgi:hypothetical protein
MPKPWLALSLAHIAWALRRAISAASCVMPFSR